MDAEQGGLDAGATGSMAYRSPRLDARFVEALKERLRDSCGALSRRSPRMLAEVLGKVGQRFSDPADELRIEALRLLPPTSGLSAPMARAVLDGMAADWTSERLVGLIEAEFGPEPGAGGPGERTLLHVPPRLCVQVVSGSVPGVTVNALLRSLLVGAPTVVKPGRGDVVLPVLFARALAEEDSALAESLAVIYWPGASTEGPTELIAAADVAVVYGSDDTVRAVRNLVPVTTRVVGYHHRVSVAVVGREALNEPSVAATEVAEAMAMFDQRGCVCPQMVFVEGAVDAVEAFAEEVARACSVVAERLPSRPFDLEASAALRQWRAGAELWEVTGGGRVIDGGPGSPWAVIFEPLPVGETGTPEAGPRPAPARPAFGRSIRVRPVTDVSEVPGALEPVGPHLQTVGYAGLADRIDALALSLGRVGASRVVPVRDMAFPPPWWIHDGRGPLRELVRWVEVERGLA